MVGVRKGSGPAEPAVDHHQSPNALALTHLLDGVYLVGIHSVSRGSGQGGGACSTPSVFKMHVFAGASKVCIFFYGLH